MFGRKKDKTVSSDATLKGNQKDITKVILTTFDKAGWKYDYDAEKSVVISGFMGDDLPIHFALFIREASLHFLCNLDFVAEPDKFKDVCWALNDINKKLSFGAFYLDPEDGQVTFEYGLPHLETNYSDTMIAGLIKMIVDTVDKFDGDLQKSAVKKATSGYNNPMFG